MVEQLKALSLTLQNLLMLKNLVKAVLEAFGTVDIVVNNAGITDDTLLNEND